jgi:hypothetical protein
LAEYFIDYLLSYVMKGIQEHLHQAHSMQGGPSGEREMQSGRWQKAVLAGCTRAAVPEAAGTGLASVTVQAGGAAQVSGAVIARAVKADDTILKGERRKPQPETRELSTAASLYCAPNTRVDVE